MDEGANSYRRFLDGDWDGLKELMESYYADLARYLDRYLGNTDDAEEAAEETFYLLTVKKPSFRGKSSFRTWLYAIGRNQMLQMLRKQSRTIHLPPDEMENAAGVGEDALDRCVREENQQMVRSALQQMPADYREVLVLRYYESMSAKEIALAMKRSTHSINALLKRAKAAMKTALADSGKGGAL